MAKLLLMRLSVGIHEVVLAHRHEVVSGVHSSHDVEGVVHLRMHLAVLALGVVIGLVVIVHIVVHGICDEVLISSIVNVGVLSDTEDSIHVLLRDFGLRELEAELVVAKQGELSV